jgi:hypothetical protein
MYVGETEALRPVLRPMRTGQDWLG